MLYNGYGYWPLEISDPDLDPATETLTEGVTYVTPVASRKAVTAKRPKRALTAEEMAARLPRPQILSKMQFIRLVYRHRRLRQTRAAFQKWNRAAGIVMPGLTRRRQQERAMWLEGL